MLQVPIDICKFLFCICRLDSRNLKWSQKIISKSHRVSQNTQTLKICRLSGKHIRPQSKFRLMLVICFIFPHGTHLYFIFPHLFYTNATTRAKKRKNTIFTYYGALHNTLLFSLDCFWVHKRMWEKSFIFFCCCFQSNQLRPGMPLSSYIYEHKIAHSNADKCRRTHSNELLSKVTKLKFTHLTFRVWENYHPPSWLHGVVVSKVITSRM